MSSTKMASTDPGAWRLAVTALVLAACGSANSRIGTEAGIGANGGGGAGGTATPTRIDIDIGVEGAGESSMDAGAQSTLLAACSLLLAWFFVTWHIAGTTLNY